MYIIYDKTFTENGRVIIIELNGKNLREFEFSEQAFMYWKKRNDPTFKQIHE